MKSKELLFLGRRGVWGVENSLSRFHPWAGHAPGFIIPNTSVLCSYVMQLLFLHERQRSGEVTVRGTWGPPGRPLIFLPGLGAFGLGVISFCFNSKGDNIFSHKQENKKQNVRN